MQRSEDMEAIRIRAKWENDNYICRGHILNGMSDSLFDVYTNVESAKELWDSLESRYMAEDSSSKKFLVRFFKHTLKHGKDDLSLVQLGSHLRIEESLRAQDSDKGKGKKWSNENKSGSNSNKKPKLDCWKCGQELVTIKRIVVVGKKNNTTKCWLVRERGLRTNPKTKVDAYIAWWIDSGATTHVCKDRCWFKTFEPVEDGSVLYMGDEHFAPIHGKGSVALEFSSGKIVTLFNVLYVPKLRHVHYKRMLEMSKDNLIPAIDEIQENVLPCIIHETISPLHTTAKGVAERKNIALKEMVNSILLTQVELRDREIMLDHNTHIAIVLRKILEPIMKSMHLVMLAFWKVAIDDEIGCKKWIFKRKKKVDGTIDKFKARLVIQGFRQKEGIDYFDTYAPVARITTIRLLLALASIYNLVIHQMDVKTQHS
ncbi:zinc finger, CCHC-type containing protein [Tanacetum coccineum]